MSAAGSVVLLPGPSAWTGVSARTAFWFGMLVASYFFVWTALPLAANSEIPGDNIEQLRWALTPDWGYSKHPPFPTLVLWVFERVAPAGIPLTYALGAMQVALMLLVAGALARATLPSPAQWIAPLMIACISYHHYRMHFYNHNTALMVAYAGALYCAWRVRLTWQWRWWVALGVCWGLGMLSKYQMAVPIACNLFFFWGLREERERSVISGVFVAGLVAMVILAPHAVWLVHHQFPSFHYASTILGADLGAVARARDIWSFVSHQALRYAGLVLLLGILTWQRRKLGIAVVQDQGVDPEVQRFFAIHGCGPMIIMVLLAALFGIDLQAHWGTAFLWVLPLYLLSKPAGARFTGLPLPLVMASAAAVQGIAVVAYLIGL